MTNRYSLSDYILNITLPNNEAILRRCGFDSSNRTFSIGGPGIMGSDIGYGYGSFIGNISVSRRNDVWSTSGDPTGSWVHTKNLDRTGSVEVEINQVSDQVQILTLICNAFELVQESVGGLDITINDASNSNKIVARAKDCYITKVPDLAMGSSATNRRFAFTCGMIIFDR